MQQSANPFDAITERLDDLDKKISRLPQIQSAPPAEIIDTTELCKRLALSEPTVIKWRRKKKIPSFKIGSCIRYNWPEVIQFLNKQK